MLETINELFSDETATSLVGPTEDFSWLEDESKEKTAALLLQFRQYLLMIAEAELPNSVRSKVGVSDVVQETFVKAFLSYETFRGSSREELKGWLRTILFKLLATHRRFYHSQKRDLTDEKSLESQNWALTDQSPSRYAMTKEKQTLVTDALSRISAEYRTCILLRHFESLTFAEVGQRMEKSEEAARKTWKRAVTQLKREMQRHESAES